MITFFYFVEQKKINSLTLLLNTSKSHDLLRVLVHVVRITQDVLVVGVGLVKITPNLLNMIYIFICLIQKKQMEATKYY